MPHSPAPRAFDRRSVVRAAAWTLPAVSVATASPAFAGSDPHTIAHDAYDAAWDRSGSAPQPWAAAFWWGASNASADRPTTASVLFTFPMGAATSVTLVPFNPAAPDDAQDWGEGWSLSGSPTSTTGEFTFTHAGIGAGSSAYLDLVTAVFEGDPAGGRSYAFVATLLSASLTAPHTISGSSMAVFPVQG